MIIAHLEDLLGKKYYDVVIGAVLSIYICTACLALSPAYADEPEVRGLWIVRDTLSSIESIDAAVDFAHRNDFNVLFVQVRGRGDAYYNSYFVPGPVNGVEVGPDFDPLEEMITRAHEKDIEVHAWFNMFLTWSDDNPPLDPEHPLNSHPEWFMVSAEGQSMAHCPIEAVRSSRNEGRYVSPALEELRSYLSKVITEVIVTYNVDGVHLDYIRYPGRDYDFHPRIIADFEALYEVDPRNVVAGSAAVDPALQYLGRWVEFRAEQVDNQVQSIRRRIDLVDPDIHLSAAVKPHASEAYYQYGQNWAGWLNSGLLDFVVTMSYYTEDETWLSVMRENLEQVDPRKVVGGIGAYRMDAKKAASQVEMTRKLGLLGHCMFSYTTFVENKRYGSAFTRKVYNDSVAPPDDYKPYLRKVYE